MKQRCLNPNHPRYADWGGRGITVCDEWMNDPKAYIEYVEALEHYREDGYTLDRINNDQNYEPGNMRWATHSEQSLNQRHKKTNTGEFFITFNHSDRGCKKFRVKGGKRFLTLEEAIAHRKEVYGS